MSKIYNSDGHIRVRVVQAAGVEVMPGLIADDPAAAQPHFDKLGWCDVNSWSPLLQHTNPRIMLDDGSVLWGYECWWMQIENPSEDTL